MCLAIKLPPAKSTRESAQPRKALPPAFVSGCMAIARTRGCPEARMAGLSGRAPYQSRRSVQARADRGQDLRVRAIFLPAIGKRDAHRACAAIRRADHVDAIVHAVDARGSGFARVIAEAGE